VSHCDALVIDCDPSTVIDRSQFPAAPGGRAGGMAAHDFYYAVRRLASDPRVRVIDLTEWDSAALDTTDYQRLDRRTLGRRSALPATRCASRPVLHPSIMPLR
jgi:hypothetical protein